MIKTNIFQTGCLLLLVLIGLWTCDGVKAKGNIGSIAQFASLGKADSLLQTEDEYTAKWSRFDIDARVQKPNGTKAEQKRNTTKNLREWTVDEKAIITTQLRLIDQTIAENNYKLNLPSEIYFIKSTMEDEGGAEGYTRGHSIVLKEGIKFMTPDVVRGLLIHELFHVLTRIDKDFRKDMYRIIGFEVMNELEYPDEIKEFKISNPDAPFKDSYINLKRGDTKIQCMMILYSDREYTEGSFFKYLKIGLLQLKGQYKKEPELLNGKAIIWQLNEVQGFFEQVGKNTGYLIDPEEALADNFVFALNNKKNMPSQWIIDDIQKRLKK